MILLSTNHNRSLSSSPLSPPYGNPWIYSNGRVDRLYPKKERKAASSVQTCALQTNVVATPTPKPPETHGNHTTRVAENNCPGCTLHMWTAPSHQVSDSWSWPITLIRSVDRVTRRSTQTRKQFSGIDDSQFMGSLQSYGLVECGATESEPQRGWITKLGARCLL